MRTNQWIVSMGLSVALSVVVSGAVASTARAANPTLDAHEQGIDDPARHSKALRLGSVWAARVNVHVGVPDCVARKMGEVARCI